MSRRLLLPILAICLCPAIARADVTRLPPGAADVIPAVDKDVPFVPTREATVKRMLVMAEVGKNDVLYDLGSGDGRIVISAAKRGARAIGVDIDPERIRESRDNARKAGVPDRAQFHQGSLFDADVREATVVSLYLLPEVNLKLRPKLLRDLRPGTRVVSHDFDMGEWKPDRTATLGNDTIYLWFVPAAVQGTWSFTMPSARGDQRATLTMTQTFQEVSGAIQMGDQRIPIAGATLRGDELHFRTEGTSPARFRGRVQGAFLQGTVQPTSGGAARPWFAQRQAAASASARGR
jgi:hypothetical protein